MVTKKKIIEERLRTTEKEIMEKIAIDINLHNNADIHYGMQNPDT